jgi:hypothetical protein
MRPGQDVRIIATMYDLNGKEVWRKSSSVYLPSDSTVNCFEATSPNGSQETVMLRLEAVSALNSEILSVNTYFLWCEDPGRNFASMGIGKVDVQPVPGSDAASFVLTNTGNTVALMIRLNLCGSDGEQILPVEYSDNYFHLLPGERKIVSIKWNTSDARGTEPVLRVSGFNVKDRQI